jgi:predicted metal-dependent peptidase
VVQTNFALRDEEKAKVEMQKTRIAMLHDFPFFGNLSLGMDLVCDTASTETMKTNGHVLMYNPSFVLNLTKKERVFVVLHEIMHVACMHHLPKIRVPVNVDMELWNIAADFVVNALIKDLNGVSMPKGVLYDPKFDNTSVEAIYNALVKQKKQETHTSFCPAEEGDGGNADDDTSSANGSGSEMGEESNASQEEGESSGDEQSTEQSVGGDNKADKPSGSDESNKSSNSNKPSNSDRSSNPSSSNDTSNSDRSSNPSNSDRSSNPSNSDNPPNQSIAEMLERAKQHGMVMESDRPIEQEKSRINVDISLSHQAVRKSRQIKPSRKKIPKILEEYVDDLTNTSVSWKRILADFVQRTARSDWDWLEPDLSMHQTDFLLPSLSSDTLVELVIAIDTSYSINYDLLSLFMHEAKNILSDVEYDKVHMVYCTDEVVLHDEFMKEEEIITKKAATGGTAYYPAGKGVNPKCLVYFTDLECYDFDIGSNPGYPILWVLFDDSRVLTTPRFGQILKMQ